MFDARVLKVLISTPGDTGPEVSAAIEAIHKWNADRAEQSKVILLPRFWKAHAVPLAGGSGQTILDSQLVDSADIVLAFFDSKLGQEAGDAVSGTAHEIDRKMKDGTPVHIWFSTKDRQSGRKSDDLLRLAAEVQRLEEYQKQLEQVALYGSYDSLGHLAEQVRSAVEQDLPRFAQVDPSRDTGTTEAVAGTDERTRKDIGLVKRLLGDWNADGRMRNILQDGVGQKQYMRAYLDEVSNLLLAQERNRFPIANPTIASAYEEFKTSLIEYDNTLISNLFTDDPSDPYMKVDHDDGWERINEMVEQNRAAQRRFEQAIGDLSVALYEADPA